MTFLTFTQTANPQIGLVLLTEAKFKHSTPCLRFVCVFPSNNRTTRETSIVYDYCDHLRVVINYSHSSSNSTAPHHPHCKGKNPKHQTPCNFTMLFVSTNICTVCMSNTAAFRKPQQENQTTNRRKSGCNLQSSSSPSHIHPKKNHLTGFVLSGCARSWKRRGLQVTDWLALGIVRRSNIIGKVPRPIPKTRKPLLQPPPPPLCANLNRNFTSELHLSEGKMKKKQREKQMQICATFSVPRGRKIEERANQKASAVEGGRRGRGGQIFSNSAPDHDTTEQASAIVWSFPATGYCLFLFSSNSNRGQL